MSSSGFKKTLTAVEAFIDWSGRTVSWLSLLLVLVTFFVVVLRYVFDSGSIALQEVSSYLHATIFLVGMAYTLQQDAHVRVDIFYSSASPKRKALVDFLGTYLLLFPICLLLLWTASPYVGNSWAVFEGSTESSGIQGVFLLKSLIPAFAMLLAMAGFNIAARASITLRETP
jgi:TRAP-type mannitol/chloroaromatic compound transport system permease small subunit